MQKDEKDDKKKGGADSKGETMGEKGREKLGE